MRNSHLRTLLSRLIRKLRSLIIFFLHSWQSPSILPIERWKERWIEFTFTKKMLSYALFSRSVGQSGRIVFYNNTVRTSIIAWFCSIFRIIWAMRPCSPCNLVHAFFIKRYKLIHLIQMSLQFIIVWGCQFLCKLITALAFANRIKSFLIREDLKHSAQIQLVEWLNGAFRERRDDSNSISIPTS